MCRTKELSVIFILAFSIATKTQKGSFSHLSIYHWILVALPFKSQNIVT